MKDSDTECEHPSWSAAEAMLAVVQLFCGPDDNESDGTFRQGGSKDEKMPASDEFRFVMWYENTDES
eukprot:724901-Rhodomonas_salina.1